MVTKDDWMKEENSTIYISSKYLAFLITVVLLILHFVLTNGVLTKNILTELPCSPPCWQGIEPGTTVNRQALIYLLNGVPNITNIRENGLSVIWRWVNVSGYNSIYVNRREIVESISLTIDFDLTVDELINKYGNPDALNWVISGTSGNYYTTINLYYPKNGFYCSVYSEANDRPIIGQNSRVYEITYLPPTPSVREWLDTGSNDIGLQSWSGYGQIVAENMND